MREIREIVETAIVDCEHLETRESLERVLYLLGERLESNRHYFDHVHFVVSTVALLRLDMLENFFDF